MSQTPIDQEAKALLDRATRTAAPGIQYLLVDRDRVIFDYSGGWADIQGQQPMRLTTTLMAYSMTKTFTAVAILQLAEQGALKLDDPLGRYLPDCPYPGNITLRQLVSHTSGMPNPIPLRWVHLADEHPAYDEQRALAGVLQGRAKLSSKPGTKFAYSNLGYWLLGGVIEQAAKQGYADYLRRHVLKVLGLGPQEMDFVIPEPANHARGYLKKYSLLNLVKGFVTDRKVWGGYEGGWLQVRNHYVNGPAFGGLIGSGPAFSRFLQDQLRDSSVLLNEESRRLLYTPQQTDNGQQIPMTLGWHIGELAGVRYFFKEGGGAGYHCEMRVYPNRQMASVIMVNSTEFNSNRFLSDLDKTFLQAV